MKNESEAKSLYENMLDRIEVAVGNVQSFDFHAEASQASYKAREDVMKAINALRTQLP